MGELGEFSFTIGTAATGGSIKVRLEKYEKNRAKELILETLELYTSTVEQKKIREEANKKPKWA